MMEVWYGQDGQSFGAWRSIKAIAALRAYLPPVTSVATGVPLQSSLLPHPLVIDSQGSMKVDLLGLPSSLPSVFRVWRNQAHVENTTTPFEM